jgi:hypothetical protein
LPAGRELEKDDGERLAFSAWFTSQSSNERPWAFPLTDDPFSTFHIYPTYLDLLNFPFSLPNNPPGFLHYIVQRLVHSHLVSFSENKNRADHSAPVSIANKKSSI